MAFNASNILPEEGLREAKSKARDVKGYLQIRVSEFQSTTNADVILSTMFDIDRDIAYLQTRAAIPGIAQYARDQENDQSYDVVTEFNGMLSALDAVANNIATTFPRDASGRLIEKSLLPDRSGYDFETFTAGQLATLRGLINAAIATIV